jgi:hypothetical protein
VYGLSDRYWPERMGKVQSNDGRLTARKPPEPGKKASDAAEKTQPTEEPPQDDYRGVGESIRHSIYYSVVTSTTLGYGDFVPSGSLQVLAAYEALTGALLIAFLTVVFARKCIR